MSKIEELARNIKNIAEHQPKDKAILEKINSLIKALKPLREVDVEQLEEALEALGDAEKSIMFMNKYKITPLFVREQAAATLLKILED